MNRLARGHRRGEPARAAVALFLITVFSLNLAACAPNTMPVQSAPLQAPTPTADPSLPALPPGWTRYTDTEDGFSLGLPPGAHVSDSGRNPNDGSREIDVAFLLTGVSSYQGMNIRVEPNPEKLPVEAIVRRTWLRLADALPPTDVGTQLAPARAGNRAAFRIIIPPSNAEVLVIVLTGVRAFFLSPVHSPAALAVEPAALTIFNQAVETFVVP